MSDANFIATIKKNQDAMGEAGQKKAGQVAPGDIEGEHKDFLKTLFAMLDSREIDPENKETFLRPGEYEKLDEEWQDKTDLAMMNLATQIRLISEFRQNPDTPNDSPQMQNMVDQLWDMKQRIEIHADVFKF